MEFLTEYGLFLAKTITLVAALAVLLGVIISFGQRAKGPDKGHLEITRLNDRFEDAEASLREAVLAPELRKLQQKTEAKRKKLEAKVRRKALKKASPDNPEVARRRVFVLDFDGDIKASAVAGLREEISCVLSQACDRDEVVLRLESGGGMVHSYGLAASQLHRLKKKQVPLTVCVDKVAASGGYMMACVADRILAAPFAVIGSIGVVAQLPNFHRLLKKNHIDFELLTAGEHKRTLTLFGENTERGREKFVEDLEDTHELFKGFVSEHRPTLDLGEVANGDVWFGQRALERRLVDDLQTSDEYIHELAREADVFEVAYVFKKSWQEKLGLAAEGSIDRVLTRGWSKLQDARIFSRG